MFQILRRLLIWMSRPARRRFERDLGDVKTTQARVLDDILKGLSTPLTRAEFARIPPNDVLGRATRAPAVHFETTSGSTGRSKRVPYNRPMRRVFRQMFWLWLGDLLTHAPKALRTGRMFLSISPRIGDDAPLADDSEYLGIFMRWILRKFLVVPLHHLRARDGETFFENLARDLIQAKDLEVVSVWSPTFFLALLDHIFEHHPEAEWPALKLISCWEAGPAARGAQRLRELFPQAFVQGKGLLATEAPVTIPWLKAPGFVPLVSLIYLEFLDEKGNLSRLDEIEDGRTYEILITTPGGLLRYRLGDFVRVTGRYLSSPCLEFLGRRHDTVDLVGEKLTDPLVREALDDVVRGAYLVSPLIDRYVVYVERPIGAGVVDRALQTIHHYRLARNLRQLQKIEVIPLPRVEETLMRFFESRGLRRGDVKPRALLAPAELGPKFAEFTRGPRAFPSAFAP